MASCGVCDETRRIIKALAVIFLDASRNEKFLSQSSRRVEEKMKRKLFFRILRKQSVLCCCCGKQRRKLALSNNNKQLIIFSTPVKLLISIGIVPEYSNYSTELNRLKELLLVAVVVGENGKHGEIFFYSLGKEKFVGILKRDFTRWNVICFAN